ncbi:hypothetical protein AVEN_215910-1 [Araneus ventricosus]|uniref:Uncharacterized protein n=1 Tax=Araneus ventricosus TaxID=182803 RepID=A0A4Y2WWN1_ARAVE|nr:hypothetical protein AVEN_215910-1 [Araneus ventricosus]
MALISIVYRLSNRRVVSSRVLVLRNQTNVSHPASSSSLRSRPLHPLTSHTMAAPSAAAGGPQSALLTRFWPYNQHASGKYLKRKEKKKSSFSFKIYARLLLSEFLRDILVSHSSSLCRIRLKIRRSAEILTTRLRGETVLRVTSSSLENVLKKNIRLEHNRRRVENVLS